MQIYLRHIQTLFFRIVLLLLMLQLSRIYFLASNFSIFSETSFLDIIWAIFVGFRFDLVSISIYNSLFIVLSILPFSFISKAFYQKILKYLFVFVNSILILANLLDSEYFKFTRKRSTFDVFDLLKTDDFNKMSLNYMTDYWYVFVLSILFSVLLWLFYPNIKTTKWSNLSRSSVLKQIGIILLIFSLTYGIMRGIDHKPITITTAAEWARVETVPLVLNTSFTIINTINKKGIQEFNTYTKEELSDLFSPIKQYEHSDFKRKNIVILIVESMGKEYSGLNNPKSEGYTPFLDSLSRESLRFRYSFANGKRSIQALPSIFNSFPSLTDQSYISSPYSANKTEGLAYLLKEEGYYSSFMHGGANGTMYFDKFCFISGFDDYYGMNEYPNSEDYDGNWGIFDEPYLQYAVDKISEFQQPFLNAIFTLSSHHPYTIPDQHKDKFPKGTSEIHESIGYADYALKKFFDKAKTTDWYDNTLFVITADHTSISNSKYFQRNQGVYAVPILFFNPNDSLLKSEKSILAQHIDIMPSILDYLQYNKEFYAFGNSLFRTNNNRFIINQLNDNFFFNNSDLFAISVQDSILYAYSVPTDSNLVRNIIKRKAVQNKYDKEILPFFKAIRQTYNNDLIRNRTFKGAAYYSNK